MPRQTARALTAKEVASAKGEKGRRVELWDAKSPGLCLRVTETGAKSWFVRYRTLDGRQPRLLLGPAGPGPGNLDLATARDRAAEVRKLAREGQDPAHEKRQRRQTARNRTIRTNDDLAEDYFARCEAGTYAATKRGPKKAETLAAERRLWRYHGKPLLGALRPEATTRADVRSALAKVAADAPIQSNRLRALVRAMFNFAVHEERVTANPVAGVKALGSETARERVLSDAELRSLWSGLADPSKLEVGDGEAAKPVYVGPAVVIALRLALLTLQRRTEIAGMRVDELRLNEASWIIGGDRTKNGRPHLVPLAPAAMDLVKDALALRQDRAPPSPFVFPSPWEKLAGQPIDGGALSHAMADLTASLALTDVRLHDLRRTGASAMASERLLVAPVVISRVLNHTLDGGGGATVTARHYALHHYAKEKRAALNAWADLVASVVSPQG